MPVSRIYFWTPVFFLFFSERFTVSEVLALESIYYACVVLLEVPSGYFSDRVGRRWTLLISTLATSAAFVLFLGAGESFAIFVMAQLAKAIGYAFLSGTDTSMHYDTLAGLGRESDFAHREARFTRNGFAGAAAAAVCAGLVGSIDLRIPYFLSLLTALATLVIALRFLEPPRFAGGLAEPFLGQVGLCLSLLRRPFLLWLFVYFLLKITTEHIPYTFAQPYLMAVLGENVGELRRTPIASGFLLGVIAWVGAFAASRSVWLKDRFGLGATLLAAGCLQWFLIAAMAVALSPWVVPLLFLRSVQAAIANPLINAAVAPQVPQGQRATYLSLHSLGGRLGYSVVLLGLSRIAAGGDPNNPEVLATVLLASTLLAGVGLLALAWTSSAVTRGPTPA